MNVIGSKLAAIVKILNSIDAGLLSSGEFTQLGIGIEQLNAMGDLKGGLTQTEIEYIDLRLKAIALIPLIDREKIMRWVNTFQRDVSAPDGGAAQGAEPGVQGADNG